jgi:hypothetical protein
MHAMTLHTLAYHEAAHAVGCLAVKRQIEAIRIEADFSGHCLCTKRHAHIPDFGTLTAAVEIASDFLGVIAGARYHGEVALDNDDDIAARGGVGDLRNVQIKLGLICGDDGGKKLALRARAWDAAYKLCENYWGSIVAIAEELYRKRLLFDGDVRRCVRAAGDHILLREQPSAMAAIMPARAPRVAAPWTVTRRDGRLVEIDERGVIRRVVTRPARIEELAVRTR